MDKLNQAVMKQFQAQDKENAKLADLENRYSGFIIYHEFGKCWLGKTGDGGFALVDAQGKELKRWSAGVNCWAEVCDIIKAEGKEMNNEPTRN